MNKLAILADALALGLSPAMVQAQEFSAVSSFPESFVSTHEIAARFTKLAEDGSGGALTTPDTVPPLDRCEPTQAGLFDMLFTHLAKGGVPEAVAGLRKTAQDAGLAD
jgi:hypothetical protein